jgi:hypothetical protein
MDRRQRRVFVWLSACLGALACSVFVISHAQQPQGQTVAIDSDDIGGVVSGANGPEAGVWVIAETRDLPVRYIKSVVTDDLGRYVVPDLPKAKYDLWVRGYGLVDSAKTVAEPGSHVNFTATPAPSAAAAAEYYPAIYWYSMLKIPSADQFGGKSYIPLNVTPQAYLEQVKNWGCIGCHQLGQKSTRTIPAIFREGHSSEMAWMLRVQAGQAGPLMMDQMANGLAGVGFKYYADWTDRIARGELPHHTPPRPQGIERNVVITLRDWYSEKKYLHDLISSDRRAPTVNAYGPLYGSPEYAGNMIPILDPVKNTATVFAAPVRDADTPLGLGPGHAALQKPLGPSAYWGSEAIWDTRINNHDSMLDQKGRLWLAATVRAPNNVPAFCKAGSDHPSAKLFPMNSNIRQLAMFDPKTKKYTFIDTCFSDHHLQFAYDANDTLWTSGGGPVVGWFNTKMYDKTGDVAKSQGWTALILDTNGNGKRDDYVEPNQPVDPAKDKRIVASFYAIMPSPADGSVWGSFRNGTGSGIVRIAPGSNPPATALSEIYYVPSPGFSVRGADIDTNGVVWTSLGSGHMGSFDRRKCKGPLNGPKALGNHCPEGWSFYQYPGPGFDGIGENSAESSYYSWVDQHNTLGLGENVPISTANLNDGFVALKDGKMVMLRVPYPLGFYAKGMDGRIDDPKTGWKGRGLWAANGDRTPWLIEGGKGTKPFAVHIQVRPDPLAK